MNLLSIIDCANSDFHVTSFRLRDLYQSAFNAETKIISNICLFCAINRSGYRLLNVFWMPELLYFNINADDFGIVEHWIFRQSLYDRIDLRLIL